MENRPQPKTLAGKRIYLELNSILLLILFFFKLYSMANYTNFSFMTVI